MSASDLAAGLLLAASALTVGWNVWLRSTHRWVSNAPPESWPELAPTMRATVSVWIAAHLLSLAGFGVLTAVLVAADDRGLGLAALALLVVAVVFVILEGTHHLTLGIWWAEAIASGGDAGFTRPIASWASGAFQLIFHVVGYTALGLFGIAVLVSDLGIESAAWATLGFAVGGLALTGWRDRVTWGLVIPVQAVLAVGLLLD